MAARQWTPIDVDTDRRGHRFGIGAPALEPVTPTLTTPRPHPATHASIVPMGGRPKVRQVGARGWSGLYLTETGSRGAGPKEGRSSSQASRVRVWPPLPGPPGPLRFMGGWAVREVHLIPGADERMHGSRLCRARGPGIVAPTWFPGPHVDPVTHGRSGSSFRPYPPLAPLLLASDSLPPTGGSRGARPTGPIAQGKTGERKSPKPKAKRGQSPAALPPPFAIRCSPPIP